MRTLPQDPNVIDYLDQCLPIVGIHLLGCLGYIPLILSFNYRYRHHRKPNSQPTADLETVRKPIEMILLCLYIVGFQYTVIASYNANQVTSKSSPMITMFHPVSLMITAAAVLACMLEEKKFQEHIVAPYKAILPALPSWEKIRKGKQEEEKSAEYEESATELRTHSLLRAYVQRIRIFSVSLGHWISPYTTQPLPAQTPICFLSRYQIRAFSMTLNAMISMAIMVFSSCNEGLRKWIIGGYGGQPGNFDIITECFMGWSVATIVFTIQAVRILKQSETVGEQEGIKGYRKDEETWYSQWDVKLIG